MQVEGGGGGDGLGRLIQNISTVTVDDGVMNFNPALPVCLK
jgi:hypothetical protein